MSSLLDRAKKDLQKITTNKSSGFAQDIILTNPVGVSITIQGLHTKTHLDVDQEGNITSTKKGNVSFSEQILIDAGYKIRNAADEVDLRDYIVEVKDSTGKLCKYISKTWFPDEHLGHITILLEDYSDA